MTLSPLVSTLIGASILMGIVVICLGIGWILTGKNRLKRGTCGMNPKEKANKKRNSCSICGSENTCANEKEKNDDNTT